MIQGVTVLGERKYRRGVTSVFEWEAPHPISDAPVGTAKPASGDVNLGLSAIHDPLVVTSAQSGRRELTIIAPSGTKGLQGRYGGGWLVTPHDGAFPVRVTRIDGTTCFISDPLTRSIAASVGEPASLQFATYVGSVPAASVAATLSRGIAWDVAYSASYGADTPTLTTRDFGLLHIVNQPFGTGLTAAMIAKHVTTLGERVPRGQQDWGPQLDVGEEELILAIRQELAPMGLTEDDIPVAAQLRLAHMSLTLANILDTVEPETALLMRAQGMGRMRSALRLIWVDSSGDGVPDDGEIQQVTRARSSWARGGNPAAGYQRPFSIGMKH